MKILVVDDNPVHQQAARQTLGADHDLTVVGSHDEAVNVLYPEYDEEKEERLAEQYKRDGIDNPWSKAREESRLPYWDVVLCDLLMPAGHNAQGGEGLKYVGTEMPVGWSLAITAALRGAKYVAVVTDKNHHNHPASAMLDGMNRTVFDLQGARALFTNYAPMVGITGTEKPCVECSSTSKRQLHDGKTEPCWYCKGTGTDFAQKGKDWAKVLKQVMEVASSEK